MLFFDDEQRNIIDCTSIGVVCVLVRNEMTNAVLKRGLDIFAEERGK